MFHTDAFHYPDLGGNFAPTNHKHYAKRPIRSTTQIWVVKYISMEFLRLFLRCHFADETMMASQNVACFLRVAFTICCF